MNKYNCLFKYYSIRYFLYRGRTPQIAFEYFKTLLQTSNEIKFKSTIFVIFPNVMEYIIELSNFFTTNHKNLILINNAEFTTILCLL